ncbi:MAG: 4Fe-4S cluster-binding domain-containing protein [Oscillospiraceae bacterium]|nr:4Fe-4S cluster-binding domain-containing protein [Oscillospiraceae bacterium]
MKILVADGNRLFMDFFGFENTAFAVDGGTLLEQERIMLLVTEKCNLKCIYCYEHQKNARVMSFEIAKAVLDEQLPKYSPQKQVVIEVFGGEPFANFKLIRQIDEYLCDTYGHLMISYETTTNGTLVHGEIQDWLRIHKNKFFIALSLDGFKEMHDRNRVFSDGTGSFDSIDIEFFAKTWPGCPAKLTISRETLPYMAEGIKYIHSLGFKCDATLSIGVDWNAEESLPILASELNKLIDYYIKNPEISLCTMLNLDFRLVFTPFDEDYRFCGAGLEMTCYDAKGNSYPCQGFAPVSIGKMSETYMDFDQTKFRLTNDNPCKRCQWLRLCPNCYAANLQSTNDIQQVDPNLCQFFKYCILASAKIQFKRIMNKKQRNHDDQLILKAISMVQKGI